MSLKTLVALFVLACPATAQTPLTLGGHPFVAWNTTAPHVLMVYHGLGNPVTDYYALSAHFASMGYAVVLPTDCEHDQGLLPGRVVQWVQQTVDAVETEFAKGRPLAVIGHSMGGGAAQAAARFRPGLSAYVSIHGAPILSRRGLDPMVPPATGPILFITGTLEVIDNAGFTSQWTARGAYNKAHSPRGLINVKGHSHMAICDASFGEMEGVATGKWLDCFARKNQASCDWLNVELCKPESGLEWCERDPAVLKPAAMLKPLTLNQTNETTETVLV